MGRVDIEDIPYDDYSDRQLILVPVVALAIALLIVAGAYFLTGTPVELGMEFTGGTELVVSGDASPEEVRTLYADTGVESVRGSGDNVLLATQATDSEAISELEGIAEDAGLEVISVETRSASFGGDTQREALFGVALAFVGMSVLVALMFRTLVPSVAVVVSAFSDMMIPVALMNVLGIELTLGAVAALLMIIGYSVDSDILLNNHILRRHGDFYESAGRAMRTGVSMTLTSIGAMVMMYIVSSLFGIPLLPEIALILVFGLGADLMNTYLMNISLLRWYKFEGVKR